MNELLEGVEIPSDGDIESANDEYATHRVDDTRDIIASALANGWQDIVDSGMESYFGNEQRFIDTVLSDFVTIEKED